MHTPSWRREREEFEVYRIGMGEECGNHARVRELLCACLRKGSERCDMFATMYLSGFGRGKKDAACKEMHRLLRACMSEAGDCNDWHDEVLLDCGLWTTELSGSVIWWQKEDTRIFHPGSAFLVSPSGCVVDWSRKSNYDSKKAVPASDGSSTTSPRMLYTFSVTRLNEKWVRSIEKRCARL